MPKIKVKGQFIQKLEWKEMDGQTGMNAVS